MTGTKKQIFIGALAGALVGFVLGIVSGKPGYGPGTGEGKADGDFSKVADTGKFTDFPSTGEETGGKDTIRYEAVDEDGRSMEIILIK